MGDILVSIRCITYNHAPYIRQCLDGFVMQKTNFRFEAIVHDDASTDGTADIVREYAEKYPEIIKPIFQTENQYHKRDGSIRRALNAAMSPSSKYMATCEGDDYWIDPYKLQKQVDFLEEHPEYGLVCTDVDFFYQTKGTYDHSFFRTRKYDIKYTFEDFLVNAWFIAPCTWVYRRRFVDELELDKKFIIGDLPLLLTISMSSAVKYFDEVTTVYRVLKKSASHLSSFDEQKKYQEGVLDIQLFYMNKNSCQNLYKPIICNYYKTLVKCSFKYGDYDSFVSWLQRYLGERQGCCLQQVKKILNLKLIKWCLRPFFVFARKIYY